MIDKRVVPMSHQEASLPGTPAWPVTPRTAPVPKTPRQDWFTGEPSLQDLLADPLVHAVLRRDGLSLRDLRQAIALGRNRLTATARHHGASDAA